MGLILKQPDLGTAIILFLILFSILLFVKIRWSSLLILGLTGASILPLLWGFLKEYQKKRIYTFFDPSLDPLGSGYHIIQSKIAVGSGGIFGKGFMKGTQCKLGFLPEQQTDFIFSVLAEEWGLIGSLLVIGLYLVLILWGLRIAVTAKGPVWSHPCFRRGRHALLACLHQCRHGGGDDARGWNSASPSQLWRVFYGLDAHGGWTASECQHEEISVLKGSKDSSVTFLKSSLRSASWY